MELPAAMRGCGSWRRQTALSTALAQGCTTLSLKVPTCGHRLRLAPGTDNNLFSRGHADTHTHTQSWTSARSKRSNTPTHTAHHNNEYHHTHTYRELQERSNTHNHNEGGHTIHKHIQ